MATHNVCLFNKFGYCRYNETCRKLHVNEMCEDNSCQFLKCSQRHPKACKWYRKYKRCKFNPCKFSHKDDLEELKLDNQKALQKIDDIEIILAEKNELENKRKEFDNKIDNLEKEIKNLETAVVEKEAVAREVIERDDRNTLMSKMSKLMNPMRLRKI